MEIYIQTLKSDVTTDCITSLLALLSGTQQLCKFHYKLL